jgi:hypothetical protein
MNTAKRAAQLLSTQNIRSFFLIKKLFVLASDGEL